MIESRTSCCGLIATGAAATPVRWCKRVTYHMRGIIHVAKHAVGNRSYVIRSLGAFGITSASKAAFQRLVRRFVTQTRLSDSMIPQYFVIRGLHFRLPSLFVESKHDPATNVRRLLVSSSGLTVLAHFFTNLAMEINEATLHGNDLPHTRPAVPSYILIIHARSPLLRLGLGRKPHNPSFSVRP